MAKQILLPNGCKCSQLTVFPSNWKSKGADPKLKWYISYWFYDASYHPKANPSGKVQKIIKGMNDYVLLQEKQAITTALLDNEMNLLFNEGFNPLNNRYNKPIAETQEVTQNTPFIKALYKALDKAKGVPGTLYDMKSTVKGIEQAAILLNYDKMSISSISKKHITLLLEKCSEIRPRWSAKRHNMYRAWLMRLFKYLSSIEAVNYNPVMETEKQAEVKKIRETLTIEQRKIIDKYLRKNHYYFWRFMIMFFHSGARVTELMKVTSNEVDLKNQTFKCLVKKRRQHEWVKRPIKNIAISLWKEVFSECVPGQYLFSKFLRPGDIAIHPSQINRRWKHIVKRNKDLGEKYNITADFYSLKHSNTTAMKAYLSDKEIAELNAHRSTAMIVNIYDTERSNREFEAIKNVPNKF